MGKRALDNANVKSFDEELGKEIAKDVYKFTAACISFDKILPKVIDEEMCYLADWLEEKTKLEEA